jgi:hypothetical protein
VAATPEQAWSTFSTYVMENVDHLRTDERQRATPLRLPRSTMHVMCERGAPLGAPAQSGYRNNRPNR